MIHMPCVSSKHWSPFGLLRLGRPWLQGKGRKEIKACTETIMGETNLNSTAVWQGQQNGPAHCLPRHAVELSVPTETSPWQPLKQTHTAVAQPHPKASTLPSELINVWENYCWQMSLLESFENHNNANMNTSICWDSRTRQALEWALEKHYL